MMGLGLPLALIAGWLVAQALNQHPKADQKVDQKADQQPLLGVKPVEHPAKRKAPQAIEPEQRLEQLALSHLREWP